MLIDRYATNEPLLGAKVEVESGTLKASAKFNVEDGDYAIDDAAFLQAIAKPGAHAFAITVSDGKDSELLEGVLKVGGAIPVDHGGARNPAWLWTFAAVVASMTAAGAWIIHRRRKASTKSSAT